MAARNLRDLADACRKSGLEVIEVPGWNGRGHGYIDPKGIIMHHTAGPATGDYPSLGVVTQGRVGIAGPLSQLGLGRTGRVYVIASGRAYHAGVGEWPGLLGNIDTIGIEAESTGTGANPWTAAQLDAYPRLVRALALHYDIPASKVIGHREWAPTRKIDPYKIDMDAIRRYVANGPAATTPKDDDMPYSDWPKAQRDHLLTDIKTYVLDEVTALVKGYGQRTEQTQADVVVARERIMGVFPETRQQLVDAIWNDAKLSAPHPVTGISQEINARTALGRSASVVRDLQAAGLDLTPEPVAAGQVVDPAAVAEHILKALPADLAKQVAAELGARLTKES